MKIHLANFSTHRSPTKGDLINLKKPNSGERKAGRFFRTGVTYATYGFLRGLLLNVGSPNSGQIFFQSLGRKSLRVTRPFVALSIGAQCIIGTFLFSEAHW